MATTPQRLRVMVLSRCYLPGVHGGGPARSLINLIEALGADVDFRIVTLDRDRQDDPPYASVRIGAWQAVEGADVLYLPRAAVSVRRLVQEVKAVSPQVIYLDGFFDRTFVVPILWARRIGLLGRVPILVAPRGQFAAAALRLKRTRKAAYLRLAQAFGVHHHLAWQASSEMERQQILDTIRTVPSERIHVVPNLTDGFVGAPLERVVPRGRGALRLCFLSRISPMKNLDFALRVLTQVNVSVEFAIYGPIEVPSYWAACQDVIARLPENVRVSYQGEVHPMDVRKTLLHHDALFLPTRGENFGHVIYEALSVGVPVLISDQTPWSDLEAHGAGWNIALDSPSGFARTIETASRIVPEQRATMARLAMAYAARRADRAASTTMTHELFKSLIPRHR